MFNTVKSMLAGEKHYTVVIVPPVSIISNTINAIS